MSDDTESEKTAKFIAELRDVPREFNTVVVRRLLRAADLIESLQSQLKAQNGDEAKAAEIERLTRNLGEVSAAYVLQRLALFKIQKHRLRGRKTQAALIAEDVLEKTTTTTESCCNAPAGEHCSNQYGICVKHGGQPITGEGGITFGQLVDVFRK